MFYNSIDKRADSGNISSFMRAFIFAAFFLPLGPVEFSSQYASFLKVCQFAALVLISIVVLRSVKNGSCSFSREFVAASLFFGSFLVITIFVQGGITEGFKNLFAWPLLSLYTAIELKSNPRQTLGCLSALLSLVMLLDLGVTPLLYGEVYHLRFLGHVQVIFQLAILNFSATLLLVYLEGRLLPVRLFSIVVTIVDCFLTDAASARVAVLFFVLFLSSETCRIKDRNNQKSYSVFSIADSRFLLITALSINLIIIFLSVSRSDFLGLEWGFNARNFIWEKALGYFSNSPLFGYGAQGVMFDMFWGASGNYAHSQLMQELVDGGIVLTFFFYNMLYTFARKSNSIKDDKIRSVVRYAFFSYMLLMILDAVNLYCYFYIFLPFMVSFKDLKRTNVNNSDGLNLEVKR